MHVVGIAASPRNSRRSRDIEIDACDDTADLWSLLYGTTTASLKRFSTEQFHDVWAEYRRHRTSDPSNTSVALAAALWGAHKQGCTVEHVNLNEYFSVSQRPKSRDGLREALLRADGLIVSTPVYFGDRSSLAQSLLDVVVHDDEILESFRRKPIVYGGVAVGAKRNGGQETTLLYQLFDMLMTGALGVGNDTATTSQYGGTVCAGDIGSALSDAYGLETAIGTGRRVGETLTLLDAGVPPHCATPSIQFWLVTAHSGSSERIVEHLRALTPPGWAVSVIDLANAVVYRCIGCDLCPVATEPDEHYSCIIDSKHDFLATNHPALVGHDAIVPVVDLDGDPHGRLSTTYQTFVERTRYLRHADYVFKDHLCLPLVVVKTRTSGIASLRVLTSMLRHNTILLEPAEGADPSDFEPAYLRLLELVPRVVSARVRLAVAKPAGDATYNPVGYEILSAKGEPDRISVRAAARSARLAARRT